jgi:two-component system sensor histidine kinase RegB
VRLDTLIRLRWLAVCGQLAAVLVVHFGLEFEVPIWACLAVIALAALLNVALRVSFRQTQWLEPDRAAWLLTFDIAELAALLYLTGGLENPFAFLLLGPVLISATALPPRMTLLIGTFAMFCATMLVFLHYDLPWDAENPLELPEIYMVGVWLSILLAIGYIGVYTWQVAEEARQLAIGNDYRGDPRDRTRARAQFTLCRGREAFARAGPALPRNFGQDHRTSGR